MSGTTKPYPWYYAVNDRPVAIVQTADGGADCLVLDFVTGNLVPDRSYFGRTVPGLGKDVDQHTAESFEALVGSLRADLLRAWSERMCRARSGSAADMADALGVVLEPPLLGSRHVHVGSGVVASLSLGLAPGVTRAMLDARFGTAVELPRTGAFASHVIAYEVTVPDAPHRCSVFPRFERKPMAEVSATGVTLRLDGAIATSTS